MRDVILSMQISYDGFIADENNGLAWMTPDTAMPGDEALPNRWDTALIGHGAYQEMSKFWPTAGENPDLPESDRVFAERINSMEKRVFTREPRTLEWNNSHALVVSDDDSIRTAVEAIRSRPGKDIVVFGGVRLAQTLVRLDLIEEFLLVTHPVILGRGMLLFDSIEPPRALELVDTARNASGAARLRYRRIR